MSGDHNGAAVGVLIVDDQESFRAALRDLVAGTEGMALLGEAASGEGAIEAVERLTPHMVVMDVRMPGMGGIEAARRIADAHPGVLVLLVSVEPGNQDLIESSGAGGFLRKQQLTTRALREAWASRAVTRS